MNHNTTHPLTLFVAVTLAVLFALPTSVALHCNGEITEIIVEGEGIYLDDRSDDTGDINHWTYIESNGVEGLQSGGDQCVLESVLGWPFWCFSDPCSHIGPDTLIL